MLHPPGTLVYEKDNLRVYEIDGKKEKVNLIYEYIYIYTYYFSQSFIYTKYIYIYSKDFNMNFY